MTISQRFPTLVLDNVRYRFRVRSRCRGTVVRGCVRACEGGSFVRTSSPIGSPGLEGVGKVQASEKGHPSIHKNPKYYATCYETAIMVEQDTGQPSGAIDHGRRALDRSGGGEPDRFQSRSPPPPPSTLRPPPRTQSLVPNRRRRRSRKSDACMYHREKDRATAKWRGGAGGGGGEISMKVMPPPRERLPPPTHGDGYRFFLVRSPVPNPLIPPLSSRRHRTLNFWNPSIPGCLVPSLVVNEIFPQQSNRNANGLAHTDPGPNPTERCKLYILIQRFSDVTLLRGIGILLFLIQRPEWRTRRRPPCR